MPNYAFVPVIYAIKNNYLKRYSHPYMMNVEQCIGLSGYILKYTHVQELPAKGCIHCLWLLLSSSYVAFLFISDITFVLCTILRMLTSSYVSRVFLRGGNLPTWPARLRSPPERLQTIQIDAYVSRKELFTSESKYWNEIVAGFVRAWHWKKMRLRNVMDMRASYGGYHN